jgi:hypothetical protein
MLMAHRRCALDGVSTAGIGGASDKVMDHRAEAAAVNAIATVPSFCALNIVSSDLWRHRLRLLWHDPWHEVPASRDAKDRSAPFLGFLNANFLAQEIDIGQITHGPNSSQIQLLKKHWKVSTLYR